MRCAGVLHVIGSENSLGRPSLNSGQDSYIHFTLTSLGEKARIHLFCSPQSNWEKISGFKTVQKATKNHPVTFANNKLQILKEREAMECHDHLQIERLKRNKMKGNSQEEWDKSPFLNEKLIIWKAVTVKQGWTNMMNLYGRKNITNDIYNIHKNVYFWLYGCAKE